MFYVETKRGVRIAVYDLNPKGEKTVFLVHGWPLDFKMFEYQINVLPKHNFRCVGIDLRGFGKSDTPWDGYTYSDFAFDIYKIIRTMNLRDITLVGFSMGGAIVIKYMSQFNEARVKKLCLIAAAAPSFIQRKDFPYGMTKAQLNGLIAQLYIDRPKAVTMFGENFFHNPISDSFRLWFNQIGLNASSIGTIKSLISLGDEDLIDDLKKITVPTGIFHGRLDEVCPYEFALEQKKGIKDSTLFTFENSGHGVFYDELEKFNEVFIKFIK